NKDHLDWRKELADLKEMGINVYPLQCLYSPYAEHNNNFWKEIGEIMDTPLLKLQDFNEASTAVRSFVNAAGGSAKFAAYEKKLAAEGTPMSAQRFVL
ncbi:MAG: hypothetical protein GTO02_13485, partial [Candidatus Dadabacteria bacterium]|nr:hypothetical protein [Candidatus Dadabacteria bacterium]